MIVTGESDDTGTVNVTTKTELYESFRRLLCDPNNRDAPYRSVYWSPSGGTTGTSLHVPVDDAENNLQRASLVPLLLAGRVYSAHTIDANLFDTGRGGYLYRAQEIFKDFVTQCQGTSLPLGWHCPDDLVVQRCHEFHANSVSASPSRMSRLAGYVLSQIKTLQQQQEQQQHHQTATADTATVTVTATQKQQQLEILNEFRFRITRGVFACEPMHDARKELIRSAFPRIEFASVMGGAEVGCWGVSLPDSVMPNGAFLYDKRVVSVRAVVSSSDAAVGTMTSSSSASVVGHLVVTNHLRERFPVQNYDTGDLGSVVPACSVCSDGNLLATVEKSVQDGVHMQKWWWDRQKLEPPKPLLGGVLLISRALSSSANGQFNAYTHTLNASELVQKAVAFVQEAQDGNELGAFVNGQVIVWFNKENGQEKLEERVNVRVAFSEMGIKPSLIKNISDAATVSMQDWIMSTLSKKDLAAAISISITHELETSDTASNNNKLPVLRDLRDHNRHQEAMMQTCKEALSHTATSASATDDSPCKVKTTVESNESDPRCDASTVVSADGLHSHSAWIGAFQASPAPLWDLHSSMVRSARDELEKKLCHVVPAKLLERVPPNTWAPYPFAMTLSLYDATIELSANLRKAVRALLSPRGLALLNRYYEDGGLAGGLRAPSHVSDLLFIGEKEPSTSSIPPVVMPIPIVKRNVSETSKISSIDLSWSRTLLQRDLSGFSKASGSRMSAAEIEEEEQDADIGQECDAISHLGFVDDETYLASNADWGVANCGADEAENADSILSQGLVFWRPDFLFDLAKANRCKSCSCSSFKASCVGDTSHSNSDCDCRTPKRPWPPTSQEAMRKVGRRPSLVPPVSVCEINARFTLNAFAMSTFGGDASRRMFLSKQRFENGSGITGQSYNNSAPWSHLGLAPLHRLVVMKDEIRKRMASPRGCPIWLVKGREKGYDCHAMEDLLGLSPVQEVSPSDLPALLNKWFFSDDIPAPAERVCNSPNCPNSTVGASIDSFECESVCPSHLGGSSCTLLIFLELHQDEIASLPASTLRYLTGSVPATRNCCCRSPLRVLTCNPLPALFLLHDKRTLSVLRDRTLMEGLVGSRTARILADTIISTVPISDSVRTAAWKAHSKVRAAVKETFAMDVNTFRSPSPFSDTAGNDPPNWMLEELSKAVCDQCSFVLKRSQSGKGAGMIYGREVSRSFWLKTLFSSASGAYVLQPNVEQATFPCILSAESKTCKPLVCHVVGCLPFLGDASFGPGIFRASAAGPYPVSVAGGGAILLPALKMDDASLAHQAPRWLMRSVRSFVFPTNDKRNEDEYLGDLKRCSAIWETCGDCALRNPTLGTAGSDNFFKYWSGLFFYSGVSVLACQLPHILSQLRQLEFDRSPSESTPWIMVSLPPTACHLQEATEMLSRFGVCVWRPNKAFSHLHSVNQDLLGVVHEIGGTPTSHHTSSTDDHELGCCVWDISPLCASSARSHNAQAFPMHTDASFEQDPPTHFLLYVLSQDVFGGGLNRLLSGSVLLRVLSPGMRSVLSREDFVFQIPAEFDKESGELSDPRVTKQSILMLPSYRWRFRSDIVSGPNAPHAVRHLEELLRTPSLSTTMRLIPGSVLFLDNGRFFHSRSQVLDASRWLKRVRFSLEEPQGD